MSEDLSANNPGTVWRSQPAETVPVNLERFLNRRTRDLYSSTRTEVALSAAAALFFVAIIALRFAAAHDRPRQLGWIAAALAVVWALVSLFWFRDRLWRTEPWGGEMLAAACREFYRKELERRRDHLRNAWLWHGPLLLACLMSVAIFLGDGFPGIDRLRTAMPLVVLLAGWTGFSLRRRLRQARQIQWEIDEIDRP